MKKQILAIHGGDAFATYEEYLANLKAKEIDIQNPFYSDWKRNLAGVLGEEYQVILPRMPNAQNAKYEEWKIWFEKHIPFLEDGVMLIGHSMGGIFLAKYLSENDFPRKISATFLVAAPFDDEWARKTVEFMLPQSLTKFEAQGGQIFLYHSKDDPVVDFGELAKYQAAIPNAKAHIFEDRQHFNQESFPEIVDAIKSI